MLREWYRKVDIKLVGYSILLFALAVWILSFEASFITIPLAVFIFIWSAAFFIFFVADYVRQIWVEILREKQEDYKILATWQMMTPEARAGIQAARVVVDHIMLPNTPSHVWHFPGVEYGCDRLDLMAVWAKVTPTTMAPVGEFASETRHQETCKAMTKFFVAMGWCKPASGNQPARWIGDGMNKAYQSWYVGGME